MSTFAAALLLAAGVLVPVGRGEAAFLLSYRNGRLSVDAEDAPLRLILGDLARRSGMVLTGADGIEDRVSLRFVDLPLLEGLRRVLGSGRSYYLVVEDGPPGTARARITLAVGGPTWSADRAGRGDGGQTGPSPGAAGGDEVLDGHAEAAGALPDPPPSERVLELQALAEAGSLDTVRDAALDPDPLVQAAALELLAAQDPGAPLGLVGARRAGGESPERLQAVQLLHHLPAADPNQDRALLGMLTASLSDPDADVRHAAARAVAERGGPEALAILREAARGAEPAFQQAVLRLVLETAPPEATVEILRDATAWGDEGARTLAVSWLDQLFGEER